MITSTNISSLNINPCDCPHCSSENYIRFGKYKDIQRYKCKNCKKTFSDRTNSPWYYSKKNNELWKIFWDLQVNQTPLNKCAQILHINIATAFYWRHKILNALEFITEPISLYDTISMTKRTIMENIKGKSKSALHKSNKIWYTVAVDVNDQILVKPFSLNKWDKNAFNKHVLNKICDNCCILTFGDHYIFNATKDYSPYYDNGYIDEDGDPKDFIPSDIGTAKTIVISVVKTFEEIKDKAFGISTKYLCHYFSLAKAFILNRYFCSASIYERFYLKAAYIKCADIKRCVVI